MATKFQIKRTSVSGRTPNTADPANTSYIASGELAVNLTDQKLYSSNGTVTFEVGANLTSLVVNSSLTIGNSTVNTTANSTSITLKQIYANGAFGTSGQVLTSNGTGMYWAAASGGAGAPTITADSFTGNGSNTQFTLSTSATTKTILVYLNGVVQTPTTDYSVSGTTLTFVTAPANNDSIAVRIIDVTNLADLQITNDYFLGNGSNTQYTLGTAYSANAYSLVFLNGVAQKPTVDYGISGSTLTFLTAPPNNEQIAVFSINAVDEFVSDEFTGNGSNTVYTLSTPSTTRKTIVSLNGITQRPVTDYSVSGTTLTFVTAPANNDKVVVRSFYNLIDAGGTNTEIQYNRSGDLAGSAGFVFDYASNNVTVGNTLVSPNLRISASNPPAGPTATGTTGTITWDSSYLYVAVGTDTWKKTPITTDGASVPGGSNTHIQYNDSNTLNGSAAFTFNEATNTVTLSNTLTIGSNLTINTSAIFIGNSTVNTTIIAGNVDLQGTQLRVGNVVVNGNQLTLGNVTITDTQISIGNSTVNTVFGATGNAVFNGDVTFGSGAAASDSGRLSFGGNSYGFISEFGSAVLLRNEQGSTEQTIFLGDTGAANNNTLFGVSIITTPVLTLSGTGILTVNTVNASLITAGNTTITGTANITGNVSVGGTLTVTNRFSGNTGNTIFVIEADADNNVESDVPILLLRKDGGADSGAFYFNDNRLTIATYGVGGTTKAIDFKYSNSTNYSVASNTSIPTVMSYADGIFSVTGNTTVSGHLQAATANITGNTTVSGDLIVSGNVFFNGTTTNVNSTNLVVEDKNIIVGDVATPTDVTADGGGITLKGTTDKTLNWVDATDAWTSSEDFNLVSGKSYEINGTVVVNSTSLGTGITGSSLTSVGTLTTLAAGNTTIDGKLLVGNSTVNGDIVLSGTQLVSNAGKIGIGTATPAGILHIISNTSTGTASFTEHHADLILEAGTAGNARLFLKTSSNNANWEFFADDSDGGFGVYEGNTGFRAMAILKNTGEVRFSQGTANPNNVVFAANGNVGIGTLSPTSKLTVLASSASMRITGTGNSTSNSTILAYSGPENVSLFLDGTNVSNPAATQAHIQIKSTSDFRGAGIYYTHGAAPLGGANAIWYSGRPYEGGAFQIGYGVNPDYKSNSFVIVLSNGNVGIGTNSPYKKLELAGDLQLDSTNANIWIKSGTGGTNGFINWTFNTDDIVYNKVGMDYDTRATTGFHIDSGYPLTLDGVTRINFALSGSTQGVWDSNGFGIGTTSPSARLDIIDSTNDVEVLRVRTSGGNPGATQGKAHLGLHYWSTGSNSPVRIGVEEINNGSYRGNLLFSTRDDESDSVPTEKVRIAANGNVGIGNSAPASALSIKGNQLFISNTDTSTSIVIRNEGNNTTGRFPQLVVAHYSGNTTGGSAGGQPVVELTHYAGNTSAPQAVASGTILGGFNTWGSNSTAILSGTRIQGIAEAAFTSTATAGLQLITTNAGTQSEKVRIAANGNVGIGNTTPAHLLRVQGNTSINGTVFATTYDVGTNMFVSSSGGNMVVNFDSSDYLTYSKTNNQLLFYIGGNATLLSNSSVLQVNSTANISGNVALGGDLTVAGNLTISGTTTYINTTTLNVGDNIITLNADLGASAPTENAGIEINRGSSANAYLIWNETGDYWFANGGGFIISNTSANAVFVGSNGNVGIGNSTPTDKLRVEGSASIQTTLAAGNTTITGFANVISNSLQFNGTSTSTTMTNHDVAFALTNLSATDNNFVNIVWRDANLAATADITGQFINQSLNYGTLNFHARGADGYVKRLAIGENINFANSSANTLFIAANGNVGIGNTAPDSKLVVNGSAVFGAGVSQGSHTVRVYSTTSNNLLNTYYSNNDANPATITIQKFRGSGNDAQAADLIGRVTFVQTNSAGSGQAAAEIRVGADAAHNTTSSPSYISLMTTSSGAVTASERVRIAANGNVGIGTTAPAYKTHIVGSDDILCLESTATNQRSTLLLITNGSDWEVGARGSAASPVNSFYIYDRAASAYRMLIDTSGNVGIGTTAPSYKLQVNGSFAATTKSFVIDHPTKPGMQLRYGSLEGPENGVYVRGKLSGSSTIELPEYWTKLVDEETITVNLTPIGKHQNLYVKSISNNVITIGGCRDINCFYTVFGERKDVDKLQVELDNNK